MPPFQGFGNVFKPQVGSMRGNQQLLGQAGEAGLFNPLGSPRLRALRRRQYAANANAMRGRTSSYGRLLGLDPMAQRQALVDSDIGANQSLAGGLNQAEFDESNENRGFFRDLYRGELDFQRQRELQRQAERAAARGGMGQVVGGLAGRAFGFIPGFKG